MTLKELATEFGYGIPFTRNRLKGVGGYELLGGKVNRVFNGPDLDKAREILLAGYKKPGRAKGSKNMPNKEAQAASA